MASLIDLHTHTSYSSACARMTAQELIEAAIEAGLDGVAVTELLMTAYMSAEQERTIPFPPPDLESFVPAVARGEWNPGRGS